MGFPHEKISAPASENVDEARLEDVIELFKAQQASGAFPGGQLVLRRNGRLLLDECLGVARGFRPGEPTPPLGVEPHTAFPAFSAGKPLAAITIALLEDRGLLDVEAPIVELFPEFGKHGKGHITTLDVLTHRAGILMPDFVSKAHLWGVPQAVRNALAETVPTYPRGTLAYHPHEFGWVLEEVVSRVTGQSLADFFKREIADPLQLPALQFGLGGRGLDAVAISYWLGEEEVVVAGVNVAEDFEKQNSAPFFEAKNPATSLLTDAASLAAFYDFLLRGGVTPSGERLLSERIIRRYTTGATPAWDRSLHTFLAVGRGFVNGTALLPSSFGWWGTSSCFGHAGAFSSLAFGDYRKNLSVAILTNGNRSMWDTVRRMTPLAHKIRATCQ